LLLEKRDHLRQRVGVIREVQSFEIPVLPPFLEHLHVQDLLALGVVEEIIGIVRSIRKIGRVVAQLRDTRSTLSNSHAERLRDTWIQQVLLEVFASGVFHILRNPQLGVGVVEVVNRLVISSSDAFRFDFVPENLGVP
jgi:hypothetical protein